MKNCHSVKTVHNPLELNKMDWVGWGGECVEMSSGFNAIIRDEFTVPFGRVLPPHKQADNHREADFQLGFLSLAWIKVFMCPPYALICYY